jgi:hypothetical protein
MQKTYSYIIQKTEKFKFYTYLEHIFQAINNVQKDYNWLLTDIECNSYPLPLKFNTDVFISGEEITNLSNGKTAPQFIWGVLSGVPKDITIDVNNLDVEPYADGNGAFWKDNYNIQYPDAEIEIIAFDSSFFIFSTKIKEISDDFTKHFHEAVELNEYNKKI